MLHDRLISGAQQQHGCPRRLLHARHNVFCRETVQQKFKSSPAIQRCHQAALSNHRHSRGRRSRHVSDCCGSASRCSSGSGSGSTDIHIAYSPPQLFDQGNRLPTQAETIVRGGQPQGNGLQLQEEPKPSTDIDYLAELIAIQQNGPKDLGFFGTRNMGFMHQNLIEILSYAMVLTNNHIYTSGAVGTNAAVIRGALRAEKPELLTVVLPQSLSKQPSESQELLGKVEQLIQMPQNDELTLLEASRICNRDIVSRVQQVICFAFHDSRLLMETCQEAKENRKIVTQFFLD